jgi:hypothetical protein
MIFAKEGKLIYCGFARYGPGIVKSSDYLRRFELKSGVANVKVAMLVPRLHNRQHHSNM